MFLLHKIAQLNGKGFYLPLYSILLTTHSLSPLNWYTFLETMYLFLYMLKQGFTFSFFEFHFLKYYVAKTTVLNSRSCAQVCRSMLFHLHDNLPKTINKIVMTTKMFAGHMFRQLRA